MACDHMNYCHNDISENEVNENLNPEVTLQDNKDRNFDDILINLVKSYPHLYDNSCKDYRDVIQKENSWVEISKILDTSPQICCNRWIRLRESFSKEKKKRQDETRSGSKASTRRGFAYFESMKFIDKFVKPRNSMTNIKFQQSNIFGRLEDKNLNNEILKWIQHGKRALESKTTPLEQIDANTFSPIKKYPMSETITASNFDDMSCASFPSTSEFNTDDCTDQSLSGRSSSVNNNSSLLSPTSVKSTNDFKKPLCMKGKFNPNISIKKDNKNKESETKNFEMSFINLNTAVIDHLNSKRDGIQIQNDPDTLFCNLVLAELKQLDDCLKQIKKNEIMQIFWRKEKSE